MKKLNVIDWIAVVVVLVGAINWALVALIPFDIVSWLFIVQLGSLTAAKIVYTVVGVAGIYLFLSLLMKSKEE